MTSEKQELHLIDIIKLFSTWAKNVISSILNGFLNFIRFSYQQKTVLIIFFAVGIAAGVIFSLPCFRIYKSDMSVKINISDSYAFYGLTQTLRTDVVSNSPLAKKLNIPDSIAESIVSIKPHYIIDKLHNDIPDWIDFDDEFEEGVNGDTSTVRMLNMLSICVKSKDPHSFPIIQDGLIYFFSNDPDLIKKKDIALRQQRQALAIIEKEIERLDNLSNYQYFKEPKQRSITVDSQAILLGERPKQLYYTDIEKLNSKKDSLQDLIEINGEIASVAKPFSVFKTPVNSLPKMVVIFGAIFIVIGYIVAIFRKNKTKIFQYLNEKD